MSEHRLLIVQPGDTLVIGYTPGLPAAETELIKKRLGLNGILTLSGPVDLAAIRASDQNVHVTVSSPAATMADAGTQLQQAVRQHRGGQ